MTGSSIDWSETARDAIRAHELLVSRQGSLDELPLRPLVRDSWKRTLLHAGPPAEPTVLRGENLDLVRERSELHRIWPVFERLLVPAATDANLLVALADAQGTLLWVAGSHSAQSQGEDTGFAVGAQWAEHAMGTSAPGVALATGKGAQVTGAEHLYEKAQNYSCSAVPIRNPRTGRIIGAIDLTGGSEAVALHSLPLLEAAVAAAESQLLLTDVNLPRQEVDYLDLCVADGALLSGQHLSLRHAEILALLAQHPEGLSNAELVELLFERPDAAAEGTVRAEMVRLRKVLSARPEQVLASRPYRVQWPLQTTLTRVSDSLESGDLQGGIDLYSGDLLPRSAAPGIIRLRSELQAKLAEVALDSGSAQQLLHLGRQFADAQLLRAALQQLPAQSPVRSLIVAEVQCMDS